HGEGTGPERLGEAVGTVRHLAHPAVQVARAVEVHDDRVIYRPALDLEDLAYGRRGLRVGAETVDRLGRKRHELAVAPRLHGGLDLDLGGPDNSHHSATDSSKAVAEAPACCAEASTRGLLECAAGPLAIRVTGKFVRRPVVLIELQCRDLGRIVPGDDLQPYRGTGGTMG